MRSLFSKGRHGFGYGRSLIRTPGGSGGGGGGFSWVAFADLIARWEMSDASTMKASQAASFASANSESLEIDSAAATAYPFSIGGWFKSGTAADQTIISLSDKDVASVRARLILTSGGNVQANLHDGTTDETATSVAATYGDGAWHFAVATFTSSNVNVYVDNVAVVTEAHTNSVGAYDRTSLGRTGGSTPGDYFNGQLDSPFVFNDEITALEVAFLRNSGAGRTYSDISTSTDTDNPGTTGMVSFWSLDETSGARMDSHGTNHLTDNNTVTSEAGHVEEEAEVGDDARSSNGNGDANFLVASSYDSISSYPVSISYWVKGRIAGSNSGCAINIDDGTATERITMFIRGGTFPSTPDIFRVVLTSGGSSSANNGTIAINDDIWHHVVLILTSSDLTLYVDGVQDINPSHSIAFPSIDSFRIFKYSSDGIDWVGAVDEPMVFDSAISPTDISELYNSGIGVLSTSFTASTLTSGKIPVNAWHLSDSEINGFTEDLFGSKTLSETGTTISVPGIPQGQALSGSIARVVDQSGNSNDLLQGTLSSRPEIVNVSANLLALQFDGVDDFLDLASFAGGALSQPNTTFVVFEHAEAASATEIIVDSSNASNRNMLQRTSGGDAQIHAGNTVGSFALNQNLHVACAIFDGATSKLYVDGVEVINATAGTETMDGCVIGAQYDGAASFFKGDIRHLSINDGLLTPTQINAIGDELATVHGTTWTDVPLAPSINWGAFSDLIARHDFTQVSTLQQKLAATFTSANTETLSVADNSSFDFTNGITVIFWVKANSLGTVGLVSKYDDGLGGEREFTARIVTQVFRFYISLNGTTAAFADPFVVGYATDKWHFLAGRHDPNAGSAQIKAFTGSEDGGALDTDTATAAGAMHAGTAPLEIGGYDGIEHADADLQMVAIWNEPLTDAQITWVYNSGAGRNYADLTDSLDADNPGTGDLVSFYQLNEQSGTREDLHGTNDLTDNNTVTYGAGHVTASSFSSGEIAGVIDQENSNSPEQSVLANMPSASVANTGFAEKKVTFDGINDFLSFALAGGASTIIDAGGVGWAQDAGTWTFSGGGGYNGDHYFNASGVGSDICSWTFTVTSGTTYQVYATWLQSGNRATDAPYTVFDDTTALETVDVNQENAPVGITDDGATWQLIGTYTMNSTSLVVKLTDDADEFVIADGVLIRPVANTFDQPLTLFIVADFDDTASARRVFDGMSVGTRLALGLDASDKLFAESTAAITESGSDDHGVHVYTVLFNGASSKVYRDGVEVASGDPGDLNLAGMNFGGLSDFFNGDLYYSVLNDGVMSNADLNVIGNYLSVQHGTPTWTNIA